MDSTIQLSRLNTTADTQPRVEINQAVVEEYGERIKAGDEFPPVIVYRDRQGDGPDQFILADGFHRVEAHRLAGSKTIRCESRDPGGIGAIRAARLYAALANTEHGLRRTNADKRRAVEMLLSDPSWQDKTDRAIAKTAKVDAKTVAAVRRELRKSAPDGDAALENVNAKRTGLDGKSYPANRSGSSTPYRCQRCGHDQCDKDGDCGKCLEPPPASANRASPLKTKETTEHTEHWRCLNCGSNELHLYGYCKPCWEVTPEEERRKIAGDLPDVVKPNPATKRGGRSRRYHDTAEVLRVIGKHPAAALYDRAGELVGLLEKLLDKWPDSNSLTTLAGKLRALANEIEPVGMASEPYPAAEARA